MSWLVGYLNRGKRLKCEVCGTTHEWYFDREDDLEENHNSLTFGNLRSVAYGYGIGNGYGMGNHIGNEFAISGTGYGWLVKYRKRLCFKSRGSQRLYTEYVALCPRHTREMFGVDKIDDINIWQSIGNLAFRPIDLEQEQEQENEEVEVERVYNSFTNTSVNGIRVGDFIVRKPSLSEGHATKDQAGKVIRFVNGNGVAIVEFPLIGERHCQLNRYDKIEPAENIRPGMKVYFPYAYYHSNGLTKILTSSSLPEVIEENVESMYLYVFSVSSSFQGYCYLSNSPSSMSSSILVKVDNLFEYVEYENTLSSVAVSSDEIELGKKGIWIHHNLKIKF